MKCCGVNGPDDYVPIFNSTKLPNSCCLNLAKDKNCTKSDASTDGCKEALLKYLNAQSYILGAVALAVGLIQVSIKCPLFHNIIVFWNATCGLE